MRIQNTRDSITKELPDAKINFVSEELAVQGFIHLLFFFFADKRKYPEERESHKRELNLKLINLMITKVLMRVNSA
jgi:hypothetical protein